MPTNAPLAENCVFAAIRPRLLRSAAPVADAQEVYSVEQLSGATNYVDIIDVANVGPTRDAASEQRVEPLDALWKLVDLRGGDGWVRGFLT